MKAAAIDTEFSPCLFSHCMGSIAMYLVISTAHLAFEYTWMTMLIWVKYFSKRSCHLRDLKVIHEEP